MRCPECGSEELEQRGYRRVYAPLDASGEVDGWTESDGFDWDEWDDGTGGVSGPIIYCCGCDAQLRRDEITIDR